MRSRSSIPFVAFQILDSSGSVLDYMRCPRSSIADLGYQIQGSRLSFSDVVFQTSRSRRCVPDLHISPLVAIVPKLELQVGSIRVRGRSRDGVGLQAAPRSPFSLGRKGGVRATCNATFLSRDHLAQSRSGPARTDSVVGPLVQVLLLRVISDMVVGPPVHIWLSPSSINLVMGPQFQI